MSRPKSQARKGPQLPLALQQQLGIPQNNNRHRTRIADRKQKRQDDRRNNGVPPQPQRSPARGRRYAPKDGAGGARGGLQIESDEEDDPFSEGYDEDLEEPEDLEQPLLEKRMKTQPPSQRSLSRSPSPSPSPSLAEDDSDSLSRGSREYSPEIVLDANSRTFRDKQAEEDAEILALEKRLGMKSKQKTDVFDDGFDDPLYQVEEVVDSKKRKREEREWLEKKRQKVREPERDPLTADLDELGSASGDDDQEDEDDAFEGFEEDMLSEEEAYNEHSAAPAPTKRAPVRENPYVAPMPAGMSTAKYIPPSRRKPPETDTADLAKLRRQAQGSLNKLSEANIISIVDEFDKLYQTNPRQDVNTVLIDLLLAAFSDPSALQNTYIILHAAFIAALYKILGADFGAEMISKLVETSDRYHSDPSATGKESLNLTSLLANLFTFGVISSALVYDHIRVLLSDFGENSAELLLRIMRDCGPQLRSDDPTALKGIVQMMNEVSGRMTSLGQSINIRTRVMMDTITDLKNNKIRQATNNAGATGEHLTRMRKALGTLNARQLRATEPLGITRSDILNSDKKGKWWLVGASWKGNQQQQLQSQTHNQLPSQLPPRPQDHKRISTSPDPDTIDYTTLFTHHKLTSPVHKSIFIALTSAQDPSDALLRLSKLRLTRKQDLEIAPVILRAVRAEQVYNPFYGAVAKMLLREKKYKMSFGIALWKFFALIGEQQDEGSDDEMGRDTGEEVQAGEIANVARLYASLVARGCLRLDILKTLNIGFTKENASLFLEVLFIALLTQKQLSNEQKVVEIFAGVDPRQMNSVAYFIRKSVRTSDLVLGEEAARVKSGCKMAIAALTAMGRAERGHKHAEDD